MQIVTLHKNHLAGTIPKELFYLPALESVDFSVNPTLSIQSWSSLQYATKLRRLKFSGTAIDTLVGIAGAPLLEE